MIIPRIKTEHKGSFIRAGRSFFRGYCISVDDKTVARVTFAPHLGHTVALVEGSAQCKEGPAYLSLYLKTRAFREEWVLMDGEEVIAATHPLALPSSRRPQAES